jgi:signal recognition particle subunit SRP72
VLAFLVKLYGQTRQIDAAIKLLDSAISHYASLAASDSNKDKMLMLLSKSALFKMDEKRYEDAAETYKRGLEISPNDSVLISGLVVCLASFDPDAAEQYFTKLPSAVDQEQVDQLLSDPTALENIAVPRGQKADKKRKSVSGDVDMEGAQKKSKTKKKRKLRHPPKVMDGSADPERWIRMRDRSYYKKAHKKDEKTGGKDKKGKGKEREEEEDRRGKGKKGRH